MERWRGGPEDISGLFAERERERFLLHEQYLNEQMVKVLRAIGYDVGFVRGAGQYLYDRSGTRYLDLLSGFGAFGIGRNHPAIRAALTSVLEAELPNLVQMDVSTLAGVLAERLVKRVPWLDKVFFTNSGAETVEAAMKFARAATGRPGLVYCGHAFHGLSYGSLSLNGDEIFRNGFGPLLPGCTTVPFNDLEALDRALSSRDVAAFFVEPIQGKGVNLPRDGYLAAAAELCRKYATLFVADEIQTGLGRTGKFLAIEHWDVEPDMVLLAKALCGGHVPVGAVLARRGIFERVFTRMDRAVVHGSTFGKNDLAMAAGITTLDVIDGEDLVGNADRLGRRLIAGLDEIARKFELVADVRGKGLMIGIELGPPRSLRLKASWHAVEAASKGLFCQAITIPLFRDHHILSQVAGHGSHTIKLLPPLTITESDCDWILRGFNTTIAEANRGPAAVLSLSKLLMGNALRGRPAEESEVIRQGAS